MEVIAREAIAASAEAAAAQTMRTQLPAVNPYLPDSEHARLWECDFKQHLDALSCSDGESSA